MAFSSIAALLVLAGVVAFRSVRANRAPGLSSATERLAGAAGRERPIEPRLSGDFPHLPLRPTVRSGGSGPPEAPLALQVVAAQVREAAARETSARALAARGAADLFVGDWDAAVSALQEAAALEPGADVLNDLAAAHLARFLAGSADASGAAKALAAAERALAASPEHSGALFNRALALEQVSPEKAAAAWQRYLERDGTSGWAEEARRHLTPSSAQSVPSQRE